MKSNRPAILLSAGFILASAAYAFAQSHPDDEVRVLAPAAATTASAPQPGTPAAGGSAPPPSAALFKDGTYTGPAVDAYYGLVQVQASVSGGKLADVKFLQYPSDRSTSREINAQAMPWLTQEAIQAQSASVDIISGATQTSEGFIRSLGAALSQAKA